MIVGATAFVVAPEENRVMPRRTSHKSIKEARYLKLPFQNRLSRARMLIINAIGSFYISKARQRAIGQIRGESCEWGNVIYINAKSIVWISYSGSGILRRSHACGALCTFQVKVVDRVDERTKCGRRILVNRMSISAVPIIVSCALVLRDGVINLPGDIATIKRLKDGWNCKLHSKIVFVGSRIMHQTLRGSARHGCNAVGNTLARNWRKPAIRKSKLRRHVIVVIKISLVVVPHRTLPNQISELSVRACSAAKIVVIICVASGGVYETVHVDRSR